MEDRFYCEDCNVDFEIIAEGENKVDYCPFCGNRIAVDEEDESIEIEEDDVLDDY